MHYERCGDDNGTPRIGESERNGTLYTGCPKGGLKASENADARFYFTQLEIMKK